MVKQYQNTHKNLTSMKIFSKEMHMNSNTKKDDAMKQVTES